MSVSKAGYSRGLGRDIYPGVGFIARVRKILQVLLSLSGDMDFFVSFVTVDLEFCP
jgi:hypothetical protein